MCGIIGLLVKDPDARRDLGKMLAPMITCMSERGPDSSGLAVFDGQGRVGNAFAPLRFSLFSPEAIDWSGVSARFIRDTNVPADLEPLDNHATLSAAFSPAAFGRWLCGAYPALHLLSVGRSIQMYKDVGPPASLVARYKVTDMTGSHAVGHTRMATESAVSPAHAHPFTAGQDFCLVHNGSLSNPHSLRRMLERRGIRFETDNDTEAACRFLEWRMREGDTLEAALEKAFVELDGFYTFLMATALSMVLVRDAFACKPAVVAETDDYVAVASEYRSLAHLPGVDDAELFEPQPERIYSWSV